MGSRQKRRSFKIILDEYKTRARECSLALPFVIAQKCGHFSVNFVEFYALAKSATLQHLAAKLVQFG